MSYLLVLIGIVIITYHIYDMYIGHLQRFYSNIYKVNEGSINPNVFVVTMGAIIACSAYSLISGSYLEMFILMSLISIITLLCSVITNPVRSWITSKFYDKYIYSVQHSMQFDMTHRSYVLEGLFPKESYISYMQLNYLVHKNGHRKLMERYHKISMFYFSISISGVLTLFSF